MTAKTAVAVDNAALDARVANCGTNPILVILDDGADGANIPAAATDAEVGTRLAVITLPDPWMDPAAARQAVKAGTWQDASADASGKSTYYRIYDSGETECKIQDTVTATGGGGAMQVNNDNFAATQEFTVTAFTLTEGGA